MPNKKSKRKATGKKMQLRNLSTGYQSGMKTRNLDGLKPEEQILFKDKLNKALEQRLLKIAGEHAESVKQLLVKKPLDYSKESKLSLSEYFIKYYEKDAQKIMDEEAMDELKDRLARKGNASIADTLELDQPIKDNPVLRADVKNSLLEQIADLLNLKGPRRTEFIAQELDWTNLSAATLKPLVAGDILSKTQAEKLLLINKLARLTGDHFPLIEALIKIPLREAQTLTTWDETQWHDFIGKKDIPLPEQENDQVEYIKKIILLVQKAFPDESIAEENNTGNGSPEVKLLRDIAALWNNNDKLIYSNCFDARRLDWTGISAANKKKFIEALKQLTTFSNMLPGLQMKQLINDRSMSLTRKGQELRRRVLALDNFRKNNEYRIRIKNFDFQSNHSKYVWTGVASKYRKMVLRQMMALQRVLRLASNTREAGQLFKAGFHSAMSIASITEAKFSRCVDLEYEPGRRMYQKAKKIASISANYFEAIRDGIQGSFQNVAANNQSDLVNDLIQIDGFDELFGNQDYCDCEHCRSIFSPAAYFVDLMYFIQEHVSEKYFDPEELGHPLYLKNRRPDLWVMELTCENTNKEIPYLVIVNEVLTAFLEKAEGVSDVYAFISQANYSTQLPVNTPYKELSIYLEHFEESLYTINSTLKQHIGKRNAEMLLMTREDINIIRKTDLKVNHGRYDNIALGKFPVQAFLEYSRISRTELDQILASTYSNTFSLIKIIRKIETSDIQKFSEQLKGLTEGRLDYIYRFIKLWKHTPWTWPEFELLLNQLKAGYGMTSLNSTADWPKFLALGHFLAIQNKLNLTLEELAALVYRIPQTSVKENQKPFYERLFDLENLFGIASTDANGDPIYNNTTSLPGDKSLDDKSPLVVAGLGITETELESLLTRMGEDYTANITLNHELLSKLYRHALMARSLDWSVEEYLGICQLLFDTEMPASLEEAEDVFDFHEFFNNSSFSVAQLLFILNGETSSAQSYTISEDEVASLVLGFQQDTEQPNKLDLLKSHLTSTFNLTNEQLIDEYDPHLMNISLEDEVIKEALEATFDASDNPRDWSNFEGLLNYIKELERWQLLFSQLEFNQESISFLIEQPTVFGFTNLKKMSLNKIQAFQYYANLIDNQEEEMILEIQEVYQQYQAEAKFSVGSVATLSKIWEIQEISLQGVIDQLNLFSAAHIAIPNLEKPALLAKKLGIQGSSLLKLTATKYSEIKVARDIVLGAIAAKYPEEANQAAVLEPFNDRINALRRDVLCDAIIGQRDKYKFTDHRDLYNFFLLDVDMGGCFRTSRIVCANSSLQLYVHRCLLNLEQSDPNLNTSIIDVAVTPSDIPEEEWSWRKNYRVWEANRKIFLYPENYIDPALRDTKTSIFKELEDELLQEKISQESAEEAYKKYMASFSELTKMRFAGAYYHSLPNDYMSYQVSAPTGDRYIPLQGTYFTRESSESLYYLFARTSTDPYQYYYRTYKHSTNTWGNWQRMELAIEAKEISVLILNGRLYIFWNSVVEKSVSRMVEGSNVHVGHNFKIFTHYAYLKEDGSWTSAQKTFLGHFTEEDNVILGRLGISGFITQDEKDKRKEYFLSEFKQMVIRKPYVVRNSYSTDTPISIYNIWTAQLNVPTVDYSVGGSTVSMSGGDFIISLPSKSWTVVNNDFSSIYPHSGVATVDIEYYGIPILEIDVDCTFTLYSPTLCMVAANKVEVVEIYGVRISLPIIFNISIRVNADSSTEAAEYSSNRLSLSKKEIVDASNADLDYRSYPIGLTSFLNLEYLTSFQENGDFDHYIETGSTNFTDTFRKIHQSSAGDGYLLIPDESENIDTVPTTTILTDEILDVLYARGVEEFLSLRTQNMVDKSGENFDMNGAYGEYYWEMFFHIPFLIASHLNANQKFKEAKWWYERIFNPTADDGGQVGSTDHYWQFREFKNLQPAKLQDILSDTNAIEAYQDDPFDPHAIARLRISAYQKTIVMKYIDNLIDWGDFLFTQDTREAIMEAIQYYQLAADLLGKRPIKLGKCETADTERLTYEELQDKIAEGSEFLIALENSYWVKSDNFFTNLLKVRSSKTLNRWKVNKGMQSPGYNIKQVESISKYTNMTAALNSSEFLAAAASAPLPRSAAARSSGMKRREMVPKYDSHYANENVLGDRYEWGSPWEDREQITSDNIVENRPKRPGTFNLVKESVLVFCVPENADLMAYWDRVEDRLYKIRNCMNIKGLVRSLALFAPPIDPNFLVRAAASGLSLEDILSLISSSAITPPYRFTYLIEKSRQYAQMVQSFGNALLAALERKDVEELTLLRAVHEQNILKLTLDIKKKQVEEAKVNHEAVQESLTNVQTRMNYYQSLIDTGLIPWETTQQVSRHLATSFKAVEGVLHLAEGISYLIPQIGSPFSMKYGGKELGDSANGFAEWLRSMSSIAESISASAGLEASFQRRAEEWSHQLALAQQEEKVVSQHILAAELRQTMAEKDLEVHEKSIDQAKATHDFYKNKFTKLALYDYLSSNLNRLFREAYNVAANIAKMTEQAYQFETFDDTFFIANDNWDSSKAGLLSADRLMLQLAQMETAFIENNLRVPEITQTFSLAMLTPSALNDLRQKGSCTIKIPEIAFEMFYPGQFRRVIKSVRLSIPAVVGPYANVSARLTLTKGEIELADGDALTIRNNAVNTSISTSSGINDSGVFELNFRDERYLPFEGAGAISEWTLELPASIRSFNYDTINDVLITLNYTAMEGNRADAEATLVTNWKSLVSDSGLFRLISLKHEFPNTYHQFLHPAEGESHQSAFELKAEHFPYFLRGNSILLEGGIKIYIRPKVGASISYPSSLQINETDVIHDIALDIGFNNSSDAQDKLMGGGATISGSPIQNWPLTADNGSLIAEDIDDVLVYLQYKM